MNKQKSDWPDNMHNQLKNQVEGVRDQEIRFLRIEEFNRVIKKTCQYSEKCPECRTFRDEIETIVPDIRTVLLHPGNERKIYDNLIDRLTKHLRKEHGIFSPLYFTYTYTAIGMGIGFIAGMIAETLRWLMLDKVSWELWVGAVIIGLLFGHIKGVNKDANIRRSGNTL